MFLKNIDYDNIQTQPIHLQYILLSMLVYQPPLRSDFYVSSKFIFNEKDNDKIHNFIKIDRRGGNIKIWYIVNKDKVSKSKTYKMNKELSRIEIKDKDLCNLIFN